MLNLPKILKICLTLYIHVYIIDTSHKNGSYLTIILERKLIFMPRTLSRAIEIFERDYDLYANARVDEINPTVEGIRNLLNNSDVRNNLRRLDINTDSPDQTQYRSPFDAAITRRLKVKFQRVLDIWENGGRRALARVLVRITNFPRDIRSFYISGIEPIIMALAGFNRLN